MWQVNMLLESFWGGGSVWEAGKEATTDTAWIINSNNFFGSRKE